MNLPSNSQFKFLSKWVAFLALCIFPTTSCKKESKFSSNELPQKVRQSGAERPIKIDNEDDPFLNQDFKSEKKNELQEIFLLQGKIKERFQGIPSGTVQAKNEFLRFWNESLCESMLSQIEGIGPLEITGRKIPEVAFHIDASTMNWDQLMALKKLPFTQSNDEFKDAVSRIILAISATSNDFTPISQIIEAQDKSLPPKKSDLANFLAFTTSFSEISTSNAEGLNSWSKLANDPNPIYRLLALKGASRSSKKSSSDPMLKPSEKIPENVLNKKLDFMKIFLSEEDPNIVKEAISQVGKLGLHEGENQLKLLLDKEAISSNGYFVNLIQNAIRNSIATRELSGNP